MIHAIRREIRAKRRHQRRLATWSHSERFNAVRARRRRPLGPRPPPRLRSCVADSLSPQTRCDESVVGRAHGWVIATRGARSSTALSVHQAARWVLRVLLGTFLILHTGFIENSWTPAATIGVSRHTRSRRRLRKANCELPGSPLVESPWGPGESPWDPGRRQGAWADVARCLWDCLCVPLCCVVCTAMFSAVVFCALLRRLLGMREYSIWVACLNEWVLGCEYFFVVMLASSSCVVTLCADFWYHATIVVLPATHADTMARLLRPACLSAWACLGCSLIDCGPVSGGRGAVVFFVLFVVIADRHLACGCRVVSAVVAAFLLSGIVSVVPCVGFAAAAYVKPSFPKKRKGAVP